MGTQSTRREGAPLGNRNAVKGMAFFGGAAKSPLAVIVMIAEMTGGYGLLAPSMVAVVVAYLLTGSLSVFYNQVESVEDSPAHLEEYETLVLKRILVADVMTKKRTIRKAIDKRQDSPRLDGDRPCRWLASGIKWQIGGDGYQDRHTQT